MESHLKSTTSFRSERISREASCDVLNTYKEVMSCLVVLGRQVVTHDNSTDLILRALWNNHQRGMKWMFLVYGDT